MKKYSSLSFAKNIWWLWPEWLGPIQILSIMFSVWILIISEVWPAHRKLRWTFLKTSTQTFRHTCRKIFCSDLVWKYLSGSSALKYFSAKVMKRNDEDINLMSISWNIPGARILFTFPFPGNQWIISWVVGGWVIPRQSHYCVVCIWSISKQNYFRPDIIIISLFAQDPR